MGLFGNMFKKPPRNVQAPAAPKGAAGGGPARARPAPKATNNYMIIILDSCRYDAFMKAEPKNITRLTDGVVEKRYSYASWTGPSHYNLLTGLLPHVSPQHEFASEYYKEDFLNYNTRYGTEGMEFGKLVPALWMPEFLRDELGYSTHARVSLPVLNSKTGINRGFDTFQLMDSHNDMAAMIPTLKFDSERPSFHLLNVGETHYPFVRPGTDTSDMPRISGVHGVFKHLDKQVEGGKLVSDKEAPKFFDQDMLDKLRDMQIDTVRYLDEEVFPKLYDMVPENTYITVTADHGELFGENGYFGHGPIMHDKVFEVPFLEGKIR